MAMHLTRLTLGELAWGGKAIDQSPIRWLVKAGWWLGVLLVLLHLPPRPLWLALWGAFSVILFVLKSSALVYSLPANRKTHVIHGASPCALTHKLKRLRVLSLNLYMRPMGISDVNGDYKSERLRDFIEHCLDHYDVLSLQEIYCTLSLRRNELVHAARLKGFIYAVAAPPPPSASFQVFDCGLLILSRYPLEDVVFEEFHDAIYADSLANKGTLRASVRFGPGPRDIFRLFNAHLQASYSANDENATQVALRQFTQLLGLIESSLNTSKHEPVLMAGDLNLDAFDASVYEKINLQITKLKLEDLMRKQFGRSLTTCTSNVNARGVDMGTRRRTEEERALKGFTELHMCIDYQLFFPGTSRSLTHARTTLECLDVQTNPFGRLTDHHGLASVFEVV